jgi:hypothetical protein
MRNGDLETTEKLDCAGVEFTIKMKLVVGGLWDRCILGIAMVLTVDCYKRISWIGSENDMEFRNTCLTLLFKESTSCVQIASRTNIPLQQSGQGKYNPSRR